MKTEKTNPANRESTAISGEDAQVYRIGCFGIATDICGGNFVEATLKKGSKVADLKTWLISAYPALGELRHFFIARNQTYADDADTLEPGDELVIIPPVAGG